MNQENRKFYDEFFCSRPRDDKKKPNLVPPLQHAAMVKLAIELWNESDMRDSIVNFKPAYGQRNCWREWWEIEKKVLAKVDQLHLPQQLKREFSSVISPIGVQIKEWYRYHRYEIGLLQLPGQFNWTPKGTIDKVKTAKTIVRDEQLDVEDRYKLACNYCFEEEIPEVWKEVADERKKDNCQINGDVETINQPFIVTYWTLCVEGQLSQLDVSKEFFVEEEESTNVTGFIDAVTSGNKMATAFFLDKLSDEEKDRFIVDGAWTAMKFGEHCALSGWNFRVDYSEVFLFLLSQMNKGQRAIAFRKCPRALLECLLQWPTRPLFVQLAERVVRFKPEVVMRLVIQNLANGWTDCTNRQLFHHFWSLTPLSYKKRASKGVLLCTIVDLFEGEHVDIIKALFEHACAVEKERLVLGQRRRDIATLKSLKKLKWERSPEVIAAFQNEFMQRNS